MENNALQKLPQKVSQDEDAMFNQIVDVTNSATKHILETTM